VNDAIGQTIVYQGGYFVRTIVGERIIPNENLRWNNPDEEFGWLTLNEIKAQLEEMGIDGVIYVWEDTPLRGTIYQYGNYHPKTWVEYGHTKGFA
jgi:hypothetical protein